MAKKYQQPPNRPPAPRPSPKPSPNTGAKTAEPKPLPAGRWEPAGWLMPCLVALAITAALYLPSIFHEYVNWDDAPNIDENPNLQYLTWESFCNIFHIDKGNVIGNYNPLPIATFYFEKLLLGKFNPHFTHFLNWVLHLATVFFVFRFLLHLGISRWGAFIGGLLFGIHPMRVESVAWATERKDVLFAMFFFAALMYYVRWVKTEAEHRKWTTYALIVVLALLSHFSKVQAVTLVLSMYLVDYWLERKWTVQNFVVEKLPFGLMALAFGLANVYTLDQQGSTDDSVTNFSLLDRFFIGTYQFCTYIYKVFVPYPMSPLYPYDQELPQLAYVAPVGFFAVLGLGVWAYFKNWSRPLVFGIFFFFLNVMFLLQWKPAGQGYLADRFTYVPYFGFFFLAAWLWDKYAQQPEKQTIARALAAGFFLMCAVMTFRQIKIWANGETLWTHVIGFEGKSIALAWGNRAHYFRGKGDFEKSLRDYTEALKISPDRVENYNSRGKTYFDMAMSERYKSRERELVEKAIADYSKALESPKLPKTLNVDLYSNRGAAYASIKNYQQAIADMSKSIELDPTYKNGYTNRALTWFYIGKYREAIADHEKFLELEPLNANIWYELGLCKVNISDWQGAITALTRAIELNPKQSLAYFERARSYSMLGHKAQAQQDVQQARSLGLKVTMQDMQSIGL